MTSRRKVECVGRHQAPVQSGRTVRADLLFKVEHRKHANAGLPIAAGIVGDGAALELLRDAPLVGVDPLGDPGAVQRLQAAHMGIDIALVAAARTRPSNFACSRCRLGR